MLMIHEIWRFITGVWKADEKDIRGALRIAFAVLVLWPIGAVLIALLGHELAFALMPYWGFLLVGPVVVFAYYYPVITTFAVTIGYTRNILRDINLVIGLELIVGVYCAWVPIANNRMLTLELILIALALFFLIAGTQMRWSKKTKSILTLFVIGITGTFFYDWTGSAQEWLTQPKELKEIPTLFREGGHFEDGLYINPQKTTVKKFAKRDNKVVRTGNVVELLYNCDRNMKIADIDPYQTVEIGHIMKRLDMENRCSYSYTGDAYPIFGAYGQVIQPKYRNDVPFPELFPGNAVVFQLKSVDGIPLVQDYVQHIGGRTTLVNNSDEKKELWVIYNYARSFQGEETGWDGSTASFTIKIASQ